MTDKSWPPGAGPLDRAEPLHASRRSAGRATWRAIANPVPRWMWLGAAGGAIAVIIAGVIFVVQNNGAAAAPPSPTGPSACVLQANPARGSARWKFALPRTLCGLGRNNSSQMLGSNQAMIGALQAVLSTASLTGSPSVGNSTSSLAQAYQLGPDHSGVYRSVAFVGLEGSFSPAPAVVALGSALQAGTALHSVPAGPHGGAMGCALVSGAAWQCVWATATTIGEFQIIDTTGQLTGRHMAVNAVRIRDAIEVRA